MAEVLDSKIYVNGGYLDDNMSVNSIVELIEKINSNAFFLGQSIHMPEAFIGVNEIPYPIDFWSVPNGDDIKWEIKTMPAIKSDEDFENFKDFINDFKSQANYYPIATGTKILVSGEEMEFHINADGVINWISTQEVFDETISDAVKMAVDEVTSGASEAFDTLKEIEDKIEELIKNSGSTINPELLKELQDVVDTHEELLNWIPVDEGEEKNKVRHWRGSREKYEYLADNNAIKPWTHYVVIDNINGTEYLTEYYGYNQVTEHTGQLLPVKDVISLEDFEAILSGAAPYDRYLVGEDGEDKGYEIREFIPKEGYLGYVTKPFDYRHGVRVIDHGLKNYIYYNDKLITYDDYNGGTF